MSQRMDVLSQSAKLNPKAIGERTEAIILAHLLRRGCVVLMPFGNNQRYDLVIDVGGGNFIRGQCKTGVVRNGCVIFPSCSVHSRTGAKRDYVGQIEVFLVYCPPLDTIYQVPVEHASKTNTSLRVEPLKPNAPTTSVRWAADYEMK